MLLYKPEHVLPILEGLFFDGVHYFKDETRREWPHGPRVKVGSLHQFRLQMLQKNTTFAVGRIEALRREELCELTDEGARHEGYPDRQTYFAAYSRINGLIFADVKQRDHRLVYVVRYKVVKVPCFGCGGSKVARFYDGTTDRCWLCDDDGFVDLTDQNRPGATERWRRETTLPMEAYR